ncbi:MAG: potassium channel protein [Rubripirellula sp.]
MNFGSADLRRQIALRSAPLMFVVALLFLVCQAVLVVLWVDVPNLSENALIAADPDITGSASIRDTQDNPIVNHRFQEFTILTMLLIWPVVILESAFHWLTRPWDSTTRRFHWFGVLFCVCPSLRMCARSPEMNERLWLPGIGWRRSNKRLRNRLQRQFSLPMIVIALMIMPVLIIEFFMKTQVAQYTWLRMMLHLGTGIIWFAFAAEFILMVSVAEKKLVYCKDHWIDLAIIVLPLFSFLRSLQFLRATGIAQTLRIPMLTKFARVYRLRGTAIKAFRALILLDLLHRFVGGNVEGKIDKLNRRLEDVEAEAKEIRRKIKKLERRRLAEQDEEGPLTDVTEGIERLAEERS